MPTIADFRARLPSLEGLDDTQALMYLQQRYAPDVPVEALAQRLGVKVAAPEVKQPKRGLMALANDTVIEAANAAAGTVGAVGDFISPGNSVSKFIDERIIRPGEESQSDVVKADKAKFRADMESAGGMGDEVAAVGRYVAGSPLLALAQAAGSFAVPGVAIKGAGALAGAAGAGAKGVTRAGLAGGAALGAAGAGGDAAGTAYDLAIQGGATEEQAQAAARQASAIPAAIGGLGGVVGAERLVAGAKGFGGGLMARALKTAGVEGAQEGIEEGVTQYEGQRAAVPFNPGLDPMKGAAGAAALGAVLGAATGGGVALLERQQAAADKGLEDLKAARDPESIVDAALRATDVPLVVAPEGITADGEILPPGTKPRARNASAIEEIRQLDTAQQEEALGLLATAQSPRTSPAVRRYAQNRLDVLLQPVRQIPVGEVIEEDPLPVGETQELTSTEATSQILQPPTLAQRNAMGKRLPVGDATELEPDQIELETIPTPDVIEAGGDLPPPEGMAPRTPKKPEPAPASPMTEADIVAAVVDGFRKTNTPQARAFVQDFDAGRIKPADVLALVGRPPMSPDERIAAAAAQAPKPDPNPLLLTADGQPYGTRSGAYVRAKREGLGSDSIITVPGGWAVQPKESASEQPDMARATSRPDRPGDGRGAADPRGGGNLRPDPDGTAGAVRAGPTPAPRSGGGTAVAVAPGGGPDAALSVLQLKRAWSDAVARGDTEGARDINDRIVAAKAAPNAAAPAEKAPPTGRVPEAAAPAPTTMKERREAEKAREPFEHAGLKVYPGRVRVGDKIEDRWAVQLPENKATGKVLGDTLHATREEAMKAAEREVARFEREQRNRAEQDAADAARKAEEEARKAANRGKSLKERAAAATLDRETSENGERMTRRQWVERKLAEGLTPKVTQEDKIKPLTRAQFNRASNEEQRAHERKIKAAGKKDVYWIGDYEVTKTEYDYAQERKATPAAPTSAPAAPASATTVAQPAVESAPATDKEPLTVAPATHKDPGEPAEPVTPAVVREAIKTGVQVTDRKPSAMKAELLAEIDQAVQDAPDYPEFQALVKSMGEKDAMATYVGREGGAGLGEKSAPRGYSRQTRTFKVDGDGVFTVNNTVRQLLTFRDKVEKSPGFRDKQSRAGLSERATDTLDRRSTDAAIANMLDEGDFQAALDFAEAKDVDIANVKLTKVLRERLDKWVRDQEMGEAVAAREAAPAPTPEPAAEPQQEPEEPSLDLMGFERIPKGNGAFELRDGNMTVSVEPTERGLYQARHRSAKSGPRLTEQLAVEWAANIREDSKRLQAEEAKAKPAAPVSSREGQMNLANRGSRIASLKEMNDQLRKIAPNDAWSDSNIENAADLDELQDQISETLVAAQRGPVAVNPLRAELEQMSGAELRAIFDRMGLAGARMTVSERVEALLAEDEAAVRAAMQPTAPTADPFAADYAALVGKTIEQTVTTDDGKTAILRMDAARAMRDFDQREKTLAELKACLGRNG